jgi:hypothetical protein
MISQAFDSLSLHVPYRREKPIPSRLRSVATDVFESTSSRRASRLSVSCSTVEGSPVRRAPDRRWVRGIIKNWILGNRTFSLQLISSPDYA